ncbi:hypothetical protein D910_11760 [Dendroctonus ponderosae]|uniref:DUF4817 domain-containing protein n=1 Tax=Dendroctonus ponderosae TaxID=77166 RepID=U4UPR5_DENPD|nr:hypothetical protein D910_11760 [Dendroctonus ponderosae]
MIREARNHGRKTHRPFFLTKWRKLLGISKSFFATAFGRGLLANKEEHLDGCPAHYNRNVRQHLDEKLSNCVIGRESPFPWPARSPDLTCIDFYLWERVKIIKCYYKNDDSAVSTFRALRADHGRHNRPTEQTISNTVEKFEETDIARPVHHRNIRSAENIAVVAQSVEEDQNSSIPQRAQHLGLLHPYKVQLTQKLKPQEGGQRRTYANSVIEPQAVDDDF